MQRKTQWNFSFDFEPSEQRKDIIKENSGRQKEKTENKNISELPHLGIFSSLIYISC